MDFVNNSNAHIFDSEKIYSFLRTLIQVLYIDSKIYKLFSFNFKILIKEILSVKFESTMESRSLSTVTLISC